MNFEESILTERSHLQKTNIVISLISVQRVDTILEVVCRIMVFQELLQDRNERSLLNEYSDSVSQNEENSGHDQGCQQHP